MVTANITIEVREKSLSKAYKALPAWLREKLPKPEVKHRTEKAALAAAKRRDYWSPDVRKFEAKFVSSRCSYTKQAYGPEDFDVYYTFDVIVEYE